MKPLAFIAIGVLALTPANSAPAQDLCAKDGGATLAQVLTCYGIPSGPEIESTLRQRITSFAAISNADSFIVGYYLDKGEGHLLPPLWIARYAKRVGEWQQVKVDAANASGTAGSRVNCLGSVAELWPAPNGYYLRSHLNPSAGCVLVFSNDLKLQKVLYGWPLLYFGDGLLVYQRSMVHFAPTHPLEIRTWNPATDHEQSIYPRTSSPLRRAYVEKARVAWSDENWCQEHNHHCDPERFDDWLAAKGLVDERTDSVAFVVTFGTDFRRESERPTGVNVLYVCRGLHSPHSLNCAEMLYEDFEARFGGNLQKLLEPAVFEALFPH